jgi:hypothetical protein
MKNIRLALALSLASALGVAPIGLAQANDAHHRGASATTKQVTKKKSKMPKKSSLDERLGQMAATWVITQSHG